MSDTPGKVLSSLTASDKRGGDGTKLGGCAGAFFQLLDRINGKRLFPHKLLTAERPKHSSKGYKEEKLPMAKLLLIADENRGGSPSIRHAATGGGEGPLGQKDAALDEKARGRVPSVVARLMGLESMPSPESPQQERKQVEVGYSQELENELAREDPSFPPVRKSRRKDFRQVDAEALPSKVKTMELHRKRVEKYPSPKRLQRSCKEGFPSCKEEDKVPERQSTQRARSALSTLNKGDGVKSLVINRTPPSLQVDSAFKSVLSPSKGPCRVTSPIKNPLSSKNTARLFEAAAKLLEPSLQPNIRSRTEGIQAQSSRRLLLEAEDHDKKGTKTGKKGAATAPSRSHKAIWQSKADDTPDIQLKGQDLMEDPSSADESSSYRNGNQLKMALKAEKKAGPEAANRRKVASAGQQVSPNSLFRNDKPPRNSEYQPQKRAGNESKVKPDWRKQEETSRRLSQPGSSIRNQSTRTLTNIQLRDASPPKQLQALPNSSRSTQASRNLPQPSGESHASQVNSNSIGDSQSSNPIVGDLLSSNRQPNASREGSRTQFDRASKRIDYAQRKEDPPLIKSLLRRRANTSETKGTSNMQATRRDSKSAKCFGVETTATASLRGQSSGESTDASCDLKELNCSVEHTSGKEGISSCEEAASSECATNIASESSEVGLSNSCEPVKSSSSEYLSSDMMERMSQGSFAEISSHSCNQFTQIYGEAASSYCACPDVDSRVRESVSYSGKTTAAILQELLMALNASRAHLKTVPDNSMSNGFDTPSLTFRQLKNSESGCTCMSEYARKHSDFPADSTAEVDSWQETKRKLRKCEKSLAKADLSLEECESASDSLGPDECGQPSPISILESPFQDAASNSSDGFEVTMQGRKLSEVSSAENFDSVSNSASQAEEAEFVESRCFVDCDKLLDTISRLHHIDPAVIGLDSKPKLTIESEEDYVKEIVKAAKVSAENVFSGKLVLLGPLVDPALFNKLEEQAQHLDWGVSVLSSSLHVDDEDVDSTCGSETELSIQSHFAEAAVQSRKLVFDCIEEALRLCLDVPSVSFFSDVFRTSSSNHLWSQVYKQVNNWKGMSISMNLDDMVEKEMNTGTGSWCRYGSEVEEIAQEIENSLIRCLLEELVREVMSSYCWKAPSWSSIGFNISLRPTGLRPSLLGRV